VQFHWDRYGRDERAVARAWVPVNAGVGRRRARRHQRAARGARGDRGLPRRQPRGARWSWAACSPTCCDRRSPCRPTRRRTASARQSVPEDGRLQRDHVRGRGRQGADPHARREGHDDAGQQRPVLLDRPPPQREGRRQRPGDGEGGARADRGRRREDDLVRRPRGGRVFGNIISMAGGQRVLETVGELVSSALSHRISSQVGTTLSVGASMIHIGPDSIVIQSPKICSTREKRWPRRPRSRARRPPRPPEPSGVRLVRATFLGVRGLRRPHVRASWDQATSDRST
jgi:hypothetical protein